MISGEDIIQACLTLMGEYNPMAVSEEENNYLPITSLITRYAHTGINDVLRVAPERYLPYEEIAHEAIHNQDGSGYVKLPCDFLGRIYFQMEGWCIPVTTPIYENTAEYRMQKNKATRGGVNKPVCAVVNTADGLVLEYYSRPLYDRTPSVAHKKYVKAVQPVTELSGELYYLSPRLLPIISNMICKYVYQSLGDAEQSAMCENEASKCLTLL